MTQSYYSLITNNGLLKEAAASSGSPVNLTHIAVGDANGTSYNPTGSQTALVHETYRTTLTHVAIDETNPNQLIIEGVINEEIGPFYIREVGIFDSDGELFAIGKYPETYKSTSDIGSGKRLYIRMILGFTNAPQVNLVMSEDLNNDPNFNANVIIALALKLAKAANLSDVEDAEEARENLGLEIGADVQAFAENLAAFANLSLQRGDLIFINASSAIARLAKGSANQVIVSNGTDIAYGPAPKTTGDIVQKVQFQTSAVASGSTTIPFDDTPPLSSEGDQYMALPITPTNASNYLDIEVHLNGHTNTANTPIAALFQDSNSTSIAASSVTDAATTFNIQKITYRMLAGTIALTTFKVRAGANSGTFTMNGETGARRLGGVWYSSITITEIKA
jgi:hypothetical protein